MPPRSPASKTRKVLPARSSRGSRIHKLIGEEAEADASFWGQAAWQEDGQDEDYSTEADDEDIVDSDFDDEEAPDEAIHDVQHDDEPVRRKRVATRYHEPYSSRPVKRKAVAKPPGRDTPVFQYMAPTVRSSTTKKSSDSSELRRQASHDAAKGLAKTKTGNRLTQAELLAEAVRTEVVNIQSLQRLEQLEEEKKAESSAPKVPFQGRVVRYYSRLGAPKTITFLNTLELPSIFHQSKPKKRISSQQQKLERMKEEEEQNESTQDEESHPQHEVRPSATETSA